MINLDGLATLYGGMVVAMADAINLRRIPAAKEIARQLSSPSRFVLHVQKKIWLNITEEGRNRINVMVLD